MTTTPDTAKWTEFPVMSLDTETTGVSVWEDRIVTATLIELHPGQRPRTWTWLLNPGIPIPPAAAAIHGITTEHAAEHGQDPATGLFEITGRIAVWLGRRHPLVAFNAAYDITLLEAENTRHGVSTLWERLERGIRPVIDPMVLDKYASRRKGPRKLGDVCGFYGVHHTGLHDSTGDALAAARLWPRIIARFPEKFPGQTLNGLHEAQVGWRREQMASLREYFDRVGKPHDGCNPGWPVLQRPAGVPR